MKFLFMMASFLTFASSGFALELDCGPYHLQTIQMNFGGVGIDRYFLENKELNSSLDLTYGFDWKDDGALVGDKIAMKIPLSNGTPVELSKDGTAVGYPNELITAGSPALTPKSGKFELTIREIEPPAMVQKFMCTNSHSSPSQTAQKNIVGSPGKAKVPVSSAVDKVKSKPATEVGAQ